MLRAVFCSFVLLQFFTVALGEDSAAPPPLSVVDARPDDVMNAKFASTDGWIGADAVYSIPLPDDSTLWVFGDTLVGQIRDGRRHNLGMVNNSFARQYGRGPDADVQLLLHRDSEGTPTSYVVPQDQPGYFWLWDGIVEGGKLYIFTTRLTSPGTISAFDWKLIDQSLLVIDNPRDDPANWRVEQHRFPFSRFTERLELLWGMEIIKVNGDIYVYGTKRSEPQGPRVLIVARTTPENLTNFGKWEFYGNGDWGRAAEALTSGVGTEGSITWLPDRRKYVYVYSPPLDPNIQMRTSATPVGPWSDPVTIYTCPEAEWDQRIFCYAGKARLVPGTSEDLWISYATNSFDMLAHVTEDARIYQPRFVKAKITD